MCSQIKVSVVGIDSTMTVFKTDVVLTRAKSIV